MHYRSPAAPVAAYIDPDWFEKEQSLLLNKLWQFFTFANLVGEHNKFVTKTLSGIPIVVQNFHGELRAFENVCLHRQAPLQTEAQGCRALTCPYHGWNYDSHGEVKAIPFDEFYQFVPEQRACMKLRSFSLATIGGLVFINLDPEPISLEKQFSESFLSSLNDVSRLFDGEIIATTLSRRNFNWKLIFENLRDGLHANFLHRSSLNRYVTFRPWTPVEAVWQSYLDERNADSAEEKDVFDEVRKYFNKGGPDSPMDQVDLQPWHAKVSRYGSQDSYYNWLAFPNLHIASGGGYAFTLEHYIPRAADITDVDVYFVLGRRKEDIPESKAVLFNLLRFTERVLAEDIGILERVQAGMHKGMQSSHWGAYELRSHRMATWMTRVVNGHITI